MEMNMFKHLKDLWASELTGLLTVFLGVLALMV